MKISARNQLSGKVSEIIEGKVNAEVIMDVNGTMIKSIITNDAVQSMELKAGEEVTAIIKASQVIIAKENPGKISARNVLEAKVTEIIDGIVNCELKLNVGDNSVAAVITEDAVKDLEISVGDIVYAFIKANSIILAK